MKASDLCISIFLLMVAIAVAGCVSNGNSPAAPSNTSTIPVTNTSPPITQVTMNTTIANSTPFITMNPVGNYTIGNVLYINGTTNLPLNVTLSGVIYPGYGYPGYRGPPLPAWDLKNILVTPGPSGINLWSVNATDIGVSGLSTEWSTYLVSVQDTTGFVSAGQYITVLPAATQNSTST